MKKVSVEGNLHINLPVYRHLRVVGKSGWLWWERSHLVIGLQSNVYSGHRKVEVGSGRICKDQSRKQTKGEEYLLWEKEYGHNP